MYTVVCRMISNIYVLLQVQRQLLGACIEVQVLTSRAPVLPKVSGSSDFSECLGMSDVCCLLGTPLRSRLKYLIRY